MPLCVCVWGGGGGGGGVQIISGGCAPPRKSVPAQRNTCISLAGDVMLIPWIFTVRSHNCNLHR
jgi:hypothetical protein